MQAIRPPITSNLSSYHWQADALRYCTVVKRMNLWAFPSWGRLCPQATRIGSLLKRKLWWEHSTPLIGLTVTTNLSSYQWQADALWYRAVIKH